MLPSKNISRIIQEYNDSLVRGYGFSDWSSWEPLITKVMDTLGVESLGELDHPEPTKCPGKQVIEALLKVWTTKRGRLWGKLFRIDESLGYTPYEDYREYTIKIICPEELISGMTGPEVFREYNTILGIIGSQDYKLLRKLHGAHIRIKR